MCCVAVLTLGFFSLTGVQAGDEKGVVLLATTTSTENSGLLDYLVPEWENHSGYVLKTVAVGTGKALKLGMAGDVDVVMVHAKEAELKFIEEGYGVNRTEIMYNDFVIVGPVNDALNLASAGTAANALATIHESQSIFVSRGDDSGTHKKELQLWALANATPGGDWYREVGQGMGKTLFIAGEFGGYTITDRGTWLSVNDKSPLEIVFEGDPPLFNQYSIMAVNPDLHKVNFAGANALIDWVASEKGQTMIDAYRVKGQKLFNANAQ
jgi:tungstate transport system substrate-binding protein